VREALRSRLVRYALVPVLIGLAILLSELFQFLIPHSSDYLFLAAILASGWLGGRGPGLLAALLAPFALDYFFLPPLYTLGISHEARLYVLPFLLSALGAAWMSSTLSGARQTRVLLQKSEEKFRRILTNQPDVAWTGDQNGRIVYISPKIERLVGYSSRELCAGGLQFVLSRVHADDFSHFQQATDALFSDRTPFDVEFRLQHKDGSWVWLSHRVVGTWEEDGIVFADGVIADVSSRKWSELELQSKTAFLEAQVNSTVDGILVVDADNRRILQNRRIVEMFGIPSDLLLSAEQLPVRRHMLSLVKDPESMLAGLNRFPDHREETSRDEVELKDGTTLDMYSAPVNGKEGQYYGRIWTFRDITQRKRSEDKLRQLSATVEQSPVSVVITDVGGRISYVNRKFTECTGYTLEEVSGKTPRVLNSGYSPRETYKKLWATILDGREWRGEFRNKKKKGELYWESASISPIVDANGAITHFVAVKEDITERRALESELR
jgi:PAS domain S-box-containing protein